MHRIVFDLKRAHLRTVAYGEGVLKSIPGMTAARFDLLCLIRQRHIIKGTFRGIDWGMRQHNLWKLLDLSKSTMSIMLSRLEKIGWIRRIRGSAADWRTKIVFLTEVGLRNIAKAMRLMFRQRAMLKYFERIYKDARPFAFEHIVQALAETSRRIQFIADAFGDRSLVFYDFGRSCSDGPWDLHASEGRSFHPLYQKPPPPKLPPKPLQGAARQDGRPFTFTPYENAVRDIVWGTEKRTRRRKAHQLDEAPDSEADWGILD